MKILIPMMMAMFTFSGAGQEAVEPTPPIEPGPPTSEKSPKPESKTARLKPPSVTYKPQDSTPSKRYVPAVRRSPQGRRVAPRSTSVVPGRPAAMVSTNAKGLTENVTIQLQGNVYDGDPLDLSLTGVGPVFQADAVTGKDRKILTHRYMVTLADGGYRVEYTIGLRIAMESSRSKNGQTINIEYREVSVSGTAIAKEGERVVISKNGERELSLTLGKAAQK